MNNINITIIAMAIATVAAFIIFYFGKFTWVMETDVEKGTSKRNLVNMILYSLVVGSVFGIIVLLALSRIRPSNNVLDQYGS
jgi:multisubunit Na+/H+ antiporter MnhB subunit